MVNFYVATSNGYAHLMRGFAYCFNKFWTDPKQSITVLYYDECPELPDNFKKVSLGNQAQYGKLWTPGLHKYFSSIKDKYVGLIIEDEYLTSKVRWGIYEKLLAYMDENVAKIDLRGIVYKHKHRVIESSIVQAHPNARYRLSTSAAIWRRDYLLKHLSPQRNIWGFEVAGSNDAVEDGEVIIGSDVDIGSFREVYSRGKLSARKLEYFPEALLKELKGFLK